MGDGAGDAYDMAEREWLDATAHMPAHHALEVYLGKRPMPKTPHRIGNDGEAPFDPEPGIMEKLRRLATDLQIAANEVEEIEDELDKWQRDHGEVL